MRPRFAVPLLLLAGCAVRHADPQVARLQAELEEARGAVFRAPVTIRREDRAAYEARVQALLDERYPPAATRRDTAVLAAVGLIAPDTDLRAHAAAPAGEVTKAYYDPSRREVVILDDEETRDGVPRHELAHALEDQTTGLPRRASELSRPGTDDLDQSVAAELLSEGGAVVLSPSRPMGVADGSGQRPRWSRAELVERLARGRRRRGLDPRLPLLLRRLPRDLYDLGALCVFDLVATQGWKGFERLAGGRLTTEQVLHRDKLGEPPVAVALGPLPLPGWTLVGRDTLGEYLLRLLLEELAKAPREAACADWGGDRLAVYRRGADLAFVWKLAWDTERAATRFAKALRALRGRSRSKAMRGAQVERRGREVLVLGGLPRAARTGVARAAWGAGRKTAGD